MVQFLVVSKTTNLDLHGENIRKRIKAGLLSSDHLRRLSLAHDDHYRTRDKLLNAFVKAGILYLEVDRGKFWPNISALDGVITIGGDGTVLEASHHIMRQETGLIGLRSSGTSVGHLCLGGEEIIDKLIVAILEGTITYRTLQRIQSEIKYTHTGGSIITDPILNDFLYANTNPAATTRYRIKLGEIAEEHKSSGIWIATPAGSTAAIAAAGGMNVDVTSDTVQFLVRELYRPPQQPPYQLTGRCFDLEHESLSIENRCDQAILALDGQHGTIILEFGDMIHFLKGPPLKLAYSCH